MLFSSRLTGAALITVALATTGPSRAADSPSDWGRYDPRRASDKLDVRGFSAQVRERLGKRGYVVRGHEWNDGSTVSLWAPRLVTALGQILPVAPSQQDAGSHARTQAYNRALGVSCEHCHTADRWADDGKTQFRTAQGMARMVVALNEGALKGVGEVACWTCHRGDVRPSRVPRDAMDAELAKWPAALASAPESVKLAMSVYNVTLGVSCDHCHTADWKQYEKTPMTLVAKMNSMFAEFPKYMPATARTQCYMCHKGSTKPELR